MRKLAVVIVALLGVATTPVAAGGAGTGDAGTVTATFSSVAPPLPGGEVIGHDINDAGEITGTADFADGSHAFVREPDGSYVALPNLDGETAEAVGAALNAQGDVVGYASGSLATRTAVLWPSGGDPIDLGTLPGHNRSWAVDINDSGVIVGISAFYESPSDEVPDELRSWMRDPADGVLVDLGTLPGHGPPSVVAINGAGVAVGRTSSPGPLAGFSWTVADGMVELPPPTHETAFLPHDINDVGAIIGKGRNRFFLRSPAEGYTVIRGIEPVTPDGPAAIGDLAMNDDGLIVGGVSVIDLMTTTITSRPMAWDPVTLAPTTFPPFPDGEDGSILVAVNDRGVALGNGGNLSAFRAPTFLAELTYPAGSPAPPAAPADVEPTFTG